MALQQQANGHTHWPNEDLMQSVALDVVRSVQLTERVLNVVEALTARVQQLEQQNSIPLPEPQDFGMQEKYESLSVLDEDADDDEISAQPETPPMEKQAELGELLGRLNPVNLQNALSHLVRFIAGKWTNRQLECILVEKQDRCLKLTAGNGPHSLSCLVEGLFQGDGRMLIPAKQFQQASQGFTNSSEMDLQLDGSKLILTGNGTSCEVEALDPDTYPEADELDGDCVALPSDGLLRALRLALHCAVRENSINSTHYTNGVFLTLEKGEATVTATDGYRLVESSFAVAGKLPKAFQLLIPAKTVVEVARLIPESQHHLISLTSNGQEVLIITPSWMEGVRKPVHHPQYVIRAKLLDVAFPPYAQVLKTEVRCKVGFNRKDLIALLQRAVAISDKDKPIVHLLSRGGNATVSAKGPSGASMSSTIEVNQSGVDFGAELNPVYLLGITKLLQNQSVELHWTHSTGPVYLHDPAEPGMRFASMQITRD